MSVDPVTDFNNDYNKLINDAKAYNDACNAKGQAADEYNDQYDYLNSLVGKENPLVLMMMFMFLFMHQGFTNMDYGIHRAGSIMTIIGDINKCGSDIEQMGNSQATDGSAPTIDQIARSQSSLLDITSKSATDPNALLIQQAIGSETSSEVYGYMLGWRQDIFDDADPDAAKYNPNNNVRIEPPPGDGNTRVYHFDNKGDTTNVPYDKNRTADGNGYIGSIPLLNNLLSQSGDPYQSSEAKKSWTDKSNEVNSSLNSGSSYEQTVLQNESKLVQTLQAFVNDMAHAQQSTSNAAVQAAGKG